MSPRPYTRAPRAGGFDHSGWLGLVEVSGPFLSIPVLRRAWPAGLDALDRAVRGRLRADHADYFDLPAADRDREHWITFVLGDLLDWGVALADGKHVWHDSKPLAWERQVACYFAALKKLDKRLAARKPLGFSAERLFQGPVADALTHVGQIAMLRRMAGSPVRGENYFLAPIVSGRVGRKQRPAVREFD